MSGGDQREKEQLANDMQVMAWRLEEYTGSSVELGWWAVERNKRDGGPGIRR